MQISDFPNFTSIKELVAAARKNALVDLLTSETSADDRAKYILATSAIWLASDRVVSAITYMRERIPCVFPDRGEVMTNNYHLSIAFYSMELNHPVNLDPYVYDQVAAVFFPTSIDAIIPQIPGERETYMGMRDMRVLCDEDWNPMPFPGAACRPDYVPKVNRNGPKA